MQVTHLKIARLLSFAHLHICEHTLTDNLTHTHMILNISYTFQFRSSIILYIYHPALANVESRDVHLDCQIYLY